MIVSKVAPGLALLRKLVAAGVIPPQTRRVVIDATVDAPVVLHVECFGDDRILQLGTADFENAIQIRVTDAPKEKT